MKRLVGIIMMLALLAITGISGYRFGLRRTTKWTEPLKAYIGGEGGSVIQADQIVVELDDGKKLTIDLQRSGGRFVSVHAGLPWPEGQDDPMNYSLNIMPGAANLIRLSVNATPKMTSKQRNAMEKRTERLNSDIEQEKTNTNLDHIPKVQ